MPLCCVRLLIADMTAEVTLCSAVSNAVWPCVLCPCRHDSGGDPVVIPQLTFDQFKDFHSKYYHPSNAR